MIRPAVMLAVVCALMASARSFVPVGGAGSSADVALGFGFLLLAALQTGDLFAAMRLPRLTGYLVCGLVAGPEVGGLVAAETIPSLRLVNGVAVGLIALTAGSELDLRAQRPRLRAVVAISVVAVVLAVAVTTALAGVLGAHLPFLHGMDGTQRWTVALTLGVVLASLSPAVAIAILTETRAAGPVSDTVLGVVVLADIVAIVAFASVQSMAARAFGATAGEAMPVAALLGIELGGSVLAGAVLALVLAAWHRFVRDHLALLVVAACVVSAEVGSRLHLDALLVALTAGILLQNSLGVGGAAIGRALAPASLPIFAVFFALAGASLRVRDFGALAPMALLLAAARAASLMVGARVGAAVAGAEPAVARWGPFAVIPQAGVSVGFAELVARHFPAWGPGARDLLLAVVTLNQLVGPVLLRTALSRAGEVGRREGAPHG